MKKIFIMLITVVGIVILGAFALNIVMPNAASAIVNSTEDMIFNATGLKMDFNGDGAARGNSDGSREYGEQDTGLGDKSDVSGGVSGFGSQTKNGN